MKEYVGMVGAQIAQVLLIIVSKYAIADGMSNYSFIFYSNALASLILLPLSLIFHRSANRPPLTFIVVCGFFTIGLLGFFAQVFGYSGISLSSATLATTLLNLIPGFTFILAILFRMETVDLSITTQAKFIGTVVSIAGAIIMTLYKGPTILSSLLKSEMIVMFSYCFVCTILAALASSIVEADLSSFSLKPKIRLMSILYSGIFGSAFQVTVQSWCIKRRGPVFVAMFHPIGIVIATFIGVIFLGDGVYLGSLLGSVIVVIGFYSVMWGKAKEKSTVVNNGGSSKLQNEEAPLLQDVVEEHIT